MYTGQQMWYYYFMYLHSCVFMRKAFWMAMVLFTQKGGEHVIIMILWLFIITPTVATLNKYV